MQGRLLNEDVYKILIQNLRNINDKLEQENKELKEEIEELKMDLYQAQGGEI